MTQAGFIFTLIGGLGFFFFGMQLMSEGLKGIAGERLKKILHLATKIPIVGILVGAFVTCLIQSSSATTVMVVGFVNAGLLVLRQAISVIIGANIGTTFTAWLVSSMSVFEITQYALPVVGIGYGFQVFGSTKKAKFWGTLLMGFGLLFLGLGFMKDAFMPLRESQYVKDVFIRFGDNPLLGVLVGMIVTMLLQSSSATIAIVQIMAFNGIISFPAAITLMLGGDVGTTITAQLAAIGTNLNARRAAMAHTLFNVLGVLYVLVFVYIGWFERFIDFIVPGDMTVRNIMVYIAIANSLFKFTNAVVFLPFIGFLEKASILLVPRRKGAIETGTKYLEKHLLETPPIALEQARRETVRMLGIACSSVNICLKSLKQNNVRRLRLIEKLEQTVDNLQSEITQYLVELSQRKMSEEESEGLPVLIHSVNDAERIGDHAENIAELVTRKIEEKLSFTEEASKSLELMEDTLGNMMETTKEAIENGDVNKAEKVLEYERVLNRFQDELKKGHVNRLHTGICDLKAGIVFVDLVDNLEKIGDHLSNIAQGVLSGMRWQHRFKDPRHNMPEKQVV